MKVATVVYLGFGPSISAMMSFTYPLPIRHRICMILLFAPRQFIVLVFHKTIVGSSDTNILLNF